MNNRNDSTVLHSRELKDCITVVRSRNFDHWQHWASAVEGEQQGLVLSVYANANRLTDDASVLGGFVPHFYFGGKWEGIYDLFINHPEWLDEYEFVWLPDDDLLLHDECLQNLLAAMKQHELWLAQPSLCRDSDVHWPITMSCDGFQLRLTTFVELMAPCFRSEYFKQILPLLKDRRTGFALDHNWCYWTDCPAKRSAIVDAARMTHPKRDCESGLYEDSTSAVEEAALHRIQDRQDHIITGAILSDGRFLPPSSQLRRHYLTAAANALLRTEQVYRVGRMFRLLVELWRNADPRAARAVKPLGIPIVEQ